jgi:hypothetical protein
MREAAAFPAARATAEQGVFKRYRDFSPETEVIVSFCCRNGRRSREFCFRTRPYSRRPKWRDYVGDREESSMTQHVPFDEFRKDPAKYMDEAGGRTASHRPGIRFGDDDCRGRIRGLERNNPPPQQPC